MFAVPAGALAVLVIVAALNLDHGFDRGADPSRRESRMKDAEALLAPRIASAEELERASGSLSEQTAIRLTDGAWVQVADENGRLAQQYSAAQLEPLAGSKLRMTEPRARMFLRDGRVMAMVAKSGLMSVPRRALESGALEGDVEIRLFKPIDGREVDVLRDPPSLVVNADQAYFDGAAGEVRCDRAVRIETDAGSFAGEGLTLVLDRAGDGVEQLVVDRALEPIRIDRAARAVAAKRRGAAQGPVSPATAPTDIAVAVDPAAGKGDAGKGDAGKGDAGKGAASGNPAIAAGGDAGAGGASAAAASPSRADSPQDTRFYQLTLHGGVEVVRSRDGVLSTIRGEQLVAIFSLESKGLDELAFVPAGVPFTNGVPAMTFSSLVAPPALAIGSLAFAAPQSVAPAQGSGSDSVTVSFGGRLEMVPVTDPALRLASADDIRFDVVGPRVELVDGRSRSQITCASLRYSVRDERVEARGRDGLPLRVNNPRMMLEGVAFWASFSEGVGRLEGPGRMAFARASERDVAWLQLVPGIAPDAARMLVSADPSAAALVVDPPMPRFDPTRQDLEITWKGGVDLRFAGDGDNAKLSGARFEGGVDVFGRQFELESTSLEVAFAKNDAERIDAIIADGGTKVRQLGAAGAMSAERLELYLAANRQGDTIPSRLVARKAVEARDAKQTIWTEDLVVTFSEKKGAPAGGDAAANAPVGAGLAAEPKLGDIDVEVVEAKGGVQVLIGEGARVFADELTGNARERKLRLTGEDVAIVRSNIIADNLRDLRFDDATRTARSEGPGRFRAFRKPIAVGEGRIERPKPDTQASLDASWSGSLDYQEAVAASPAAQGGAEAAAAESGATAAARPAGRGVLDIRGDVKLRSAPDARTSDAVDANSVVLDLAVAGEDAAKSASGKAGTDATADAARALTHFLARGQARLESRSWADDAHTGEPKLFRITGDHIEYDMLTREGLVVGDGGLLVNLPVDAEKGPAAAPKGVTPIALGAEGTTRFSWKQRMALERIKGDRYAVRMDDGVEVLHAGAREQDRMSMRCDALEAKVRRADGMESGEAGSVDLGGPAELLGVKGSGNVFIRTPQQDLECGEFDYSVESGIATLRAAPGRAVTVVFADRPTPLQAQEIDWDLRQGRLEIRKPLVTGGR